MPSYEELDNRYERAAYHGSRTVGWEQPEAWRMRATSVIASLGVPAEAVLDFGAGPAHLVRALREMGLDAHGLEPSQVARDAALVTHGIELSEAILPEWTSRFDAVVMLHSLEHVRDPVRTLGLLRGVLREGGRLCIEVPHAGGTGMRRRARREAILDLPVHLHHFTPRTLERVLERASYELETVTLVNPPSVESLLALRSRLRPSGGHRSGGARGGVERDTATARIWTGAVLPGLRRLLPGDKFQAVARAC